MAITVSNISICSVPASTDYFTQMPSGVSDSRDLFSTLGSNIYELSGNDTFVTIFENDILKIEGKAYKNDSRPGMDELKFYDKRISTLINTFFIGNLRNCYLSFGYDDSQHLAYYLIAGQYYYTGEWDNVSGSYYGIFGATPADRQQFYELISGSQTISYTANGGGATHIAKRTGQLKNLSSNLSDILMVSGGGGGGLIVGEDTYTGKEAGGISGSGDNSADQSTGNAFGQGESGTNASGGGSGLYGGYKGTSAKSGGAGSGYIGNSLLSNKKMVGYNVPTSSAEGTKTESVEVFDSNYVANKPKAGNGHCRIKLLNEVTINDAFDLFNTTDVSSKVVNSYSKDRIYLNPSEDTYTDFISYLGNPDYMLVGGQDSNGKKTPTIDTVNKTIAYTNTSMGSSASWTLIPITQLSNVIKIKATIKFDSKYNQYSSLIVKLYYIDGNTLATGNSYEIYIPWQSSSNYNVGDWYDLEVNCSMAKCDYICFGTGWDTVTFKNIKLYSM